MPEASTIPLRLFPLRAVLFPGMRMPLYIFEDRYRQMIGECLDEGEPFGVALIKRGDEVGGPAVVYPIGTIARIQHVERMDDGAMNIVVVGEARFAIVEVIQATPYMSGRVTLLPAIGADEASDDVAALTAGVVEKFATYDRLKSQLDDDWDYDGNLPHDPAGVAYFVASAIPLPHSDKQALLTQNSLDGLLTRERELLGARNYHTSAVLAARKLWESQMDESPTQPRPFNLN